MGQIEKTVFISYRRTNLPWALAIYQYLTSRGYDAFFDYNSIKSGDFEQIITQNIKGRAHFVVLLTPSALERCDDPDDWLRREIELAIEHKRNIVPLFFESFDFSSPAVSKYLTGRMALLRKYNGMTVPAEYFEAAMTRLCNDFLNVPLSAVLHPISQNVEAAVKVQQAAASNATKVAQKELTAQEWFEKGIKAADPDEKIQYYSEAIRLSPAYADAYNNRGVAYDSKNELDPAIRDYSEAIRLKADYVDAFYNRGVARKHKGDLDGAIQDYSEAIRLKPDNIKALNNRGITYKDKGDPERAIQDYNEALRIKPDYAFAYNNRGIARKAKGDLDGAIQDYTKAIQFNPEFAEAYFNRGIALKDKGDLDEAIKSYNEAVRLKPNDADHYNNRGVARRDKGDLDNAIKDYLEAIRLNPNFANAFNNLGDAYFKKADYDRAIANFEKALQIRPDFELARNNLKITRDRKKA